MRLASPRIVVIDDTPAHLSGLGQCFARDGVASLQILFNGDVAELVPCADARVIFADLHLVEGGGAAAGARDFALIGGVLETLGPVGPYVLVLWTRYPDYAAALRAYLVENLRGVVLPFDVVALDKMQHLTADGGVRDAANLMAEVSRIYRAQPQIAALVNWEEHVMAAASQTLASLLKLIPENDAAPEATLARLLGRLGAEAVGAEHVEANKFAAVNEALLPILADRIGAMSATGSDEVWNRAFATEDLASPFSLDDAARLNRTVHIAEGGNDPSARGAVVLLTAFTSIGTFEQCFGTAAPDVASSEFCCKDYADGDSRFRWVAIQTQAVCDFAQKRPGTRPFLLALEMPWASLKDGSRPQAAWVSPPLFLNNRATAIVANFRFGFTLAPNQCEGQPEYRIREQLLTSMAHDYHAYGARPGTLNFQEVSQKAAAKLADRLKKKAISAPQPGEIRVVENVNLVPSAGQSVMEEPAMPNDQAAGVASEAARIRTIPSTERTEIRQVGDFAPTERVPPERERSVRATSTSSPLSLEGLNERADGNESGS